MIYRVEFTKRADRALDRLPAEARLRIVRRAESLASNPRPSGSVKLSGKEDMYRLRFGDYRMIYEIQDKAVLVLVLDVGHRREVYRNL
jgi:mRNA interferase RelE/StbE